MENFAKKFLKMNFKNEYGFGSIHIKARCLNDKRFAGKKVSRGRILRNRFVKGKGGPLESQNKLKRSAV